MDLLKNECGYTLIETLVSFSLLGLIIIFSTVFITKMFENPGLLLKKEALLLANSEINRAINNNSVTDTLYTEKNLRVKRNVFFKNQKKILVVKVQNKNNEKEILSLSYKSGVRKE